MSWGIFNDYELLNHLKMAADSAERYTDPEFRAGYMAALSDIATGFGLTFPHRADFIQDQDHSGRYGYDLVAPTGRQPSIQCFPTSQLYLPPNRQEEE